MASDDDHNNAVLNQRSATRLADGVGVRRGAADQAQRAQRADRRRRASCGTGSADDRPRRPSRAGGEVSCVGERLSRSV